MPKTSQPSGLTAKQERFIAEYLIDGSGKRAALAAGYSPQTAMRQASELLQKPLVKKALNARRAKIATKLEVTAERVLAEIAKMGFANMLDYITVTESGDAVVDFTALDRDRAAAIQEVTIDEYTEGRGDDARNVKRVKFKLADKRANLELLGKNLRLFTDKVELTGKDGGPIQATNVPPEEAYKRMLGGG